MAKQISHHERQLRSRRHWQAHVKALRESGLGRTEYCRQHNLSYHALTYWHRKLSRPANSESTLVPVALGHGVRQTGQRPDQAALRVILPGRFSVEVGDAFSPTTLVRLLATLENR